MWWPGITCFVLSAFWFTAYHFRDVVAMILHSYAISYDKKNKLKAKIIGRGIDVALVISALFAFGTGVYYGWKIYELFK